VLLLLNLVAAITTTLSIARRYWCISYPCPRPSCSIGACACSFLLALGVDPNLNPYHQTLTTFTTLEKEAPATTVVSAKPVTPYEVGLSW